MLKVVFYLDLAIQCQGILITYQQLMYLLMHQHTLAVQRSLFFPLILFFVACSMLTCYQEGKLHENCFHIL